MTQHKAPTDLTRRALMGSLMTGAALIALPIPLRAASDGVREFSLIAKKATVPLVGGEYPDTEVWGYDGQAPGPVLRATQGERIRIHVTNALDEPTTVHWHGLRIPIDMDGVPGISQDPIEPGESFTYEFDLPDAGTFWYHSHVSTSEQVGRGLHGTLIVDEATPPIVERDVLWVLDDWRLDQQAQITDDFGRGMDISHGGRTGNLVTVNGRRPGTFDVRAGERIRLRLVNVSNARIFGLQFDGHAPHVIAYDGHPVQPHMPDGPDGQGGPDGIVVLGPGQRADLILDCTGKPGETFAISDAIYGDDTYNVFTMTYGPDAPLREGPPAPIASLAPNPLSDPDLQSAVRHEVTIDGGAMGSMQSAGYKGQSMPINELVKQGRVWSINGIAAHTTAMAPMLTMKHGSSNIITVRNDTVFPHPMHLHGHAFRIISQDGKPDPLRPWVDTILMPARSTAEIAFVADNLGDWLFHCHILEHVAGGMTSVIRVA